MTFFANSGIAWPNLEQVTRQAGEGALEAASDLWRVLATVEGRTSDTVVGDDGRKQIYNCAHKLRDAANLYRKAVDQIGRQTVSGLTPAERELAAIGSYSYYESYETNFYRLFRDELISLDGLYRDLIKRLEILASQILTFELDRNKQDLAPLAFQMMRQWEALATLARVIAVVNQRGADFERG